MSRASVAVLVLTCCSLIASLVPAAVAQAQLAPENVLLIVNTESADSQAIAAAYAARYPGVHVWTYSGSTESTIDRPTFESELRAPLDAHLRAADDGQGNPLWQTVRVLVTTKGVPHRVYDVDGTQIGDNVAAVQQQYNAILYDAACLDSELTLVHQCLAAGDPAEPDRYANNYVRNPYYGATSRLTEYARTFATAAKTFELVGKGWDAQAQSEPEAQLTPGDLYLVTRLSGYTAADAVAAIGRAGQMPVRASQVCVVLDRNDRRLDAFDFPHTRNALEAAGFSVVYDGGDTFVTQADRPVIAYGGYGVNHTYGDVPPPGSCYVLEDLAFDIAPGAIFNTYESWNGRCFSSALPHDAHGQIADWISRGGTLAVGHVFEPYTAGVVDDLVMFERMLLRGWTFAEAAYAGMAYLSWQNVVVGDPLARFDLVPEVTAWAVVFGHGPAGEQVRPVLDGDVEPRLAGVTEFRVALSNPLDPATLAPSAVEVTGQQNGDCSSYVDALTLDASNALLTITLASALPDADRYTIRLTGVLTGLGGTALAGRTTLELGVLAGDVDGSGRVEPGDMGLVRQATGMAVAGGTEMLRDVDASSQVTGADVLAVRSHLGRALP